MTKPEFQVPMVPYDRALFTPEQQAGRDDAVQHWKEYRGDETDPPTWEGGAAGSGSSFAWAVKHGLVPDTTDGLDAWLMYCRPSLEEHVRAGRLEWAVLLTCWDFAADARMVLFGRHSTSGTLGNWRRWGWTSGATHDAARRLFEKWLGRAALEDVAPAPDAPPDTPAPEAEGKAWKPAYNLDAIEPEEANQPVVYVGLAICERLDRLIALMEDRAEDAG